MLENNIINKIEDLFNSKLWETFDVEIPIALKLENNEIVYILFVKTDITLEMSIFYGEEAPYYLKKSLEMPDVDEENLMRIKDYILSIKSLNLVCFLNPETPSDFVGIEENEFLINNRFLVVSQDLFSSEINNLDKEEKNILNQCLDLFDSLELTLNSDPDFIDKTPSFLEGRGVINLFKKKDAFYIMEKFAVPNVPHVEEIRPVLVNDLQKGRLKRLERIDTIQVDLISSGERIPTENGFRIPLIGFIVEENSGFAFPFLSEIDYKENPNAYLSDFIERLLELEFYPKTIRVTNTRTFSFLEDFCHKLNINLEMVPYLVELEQSELSYSQFQSLEEDEFMDQINLQFEETDGLFEDMINSLLENGDLESEELSDFNTSYLDSEKEFVDFIKQQHGNSKTKTVTPNDKIIRFEKNIKKD